MTTNKDHQHQIPDKNEPNLVWRERQTAPTNNQGDKVSIRYDEHKYGFNYGAADITRIHSDDAKGWVLLQLKTPKRRLQIYVTKGGKVRIFDELDSGKEIKL